MAMSGRKILEKIVSILLDILIVIFGFIQSADAVFLINSFKQQIISVVFTIIPPVLIRVNHIYVNRTILIQNIVNHQVHFLIHQYHRQLLLLIALVLV